MSKYLRNLQAPAKTRYLRKLSLLGLDDTDDPYCDVIASKFRDDMTLQPPVEFGNIFGFFVFSGHHYVSFTFDKMVTTYASVLLLGTSLTS